LPAASTASCGNHKGSCAATNVGRAAAAAAVPELRHASRAAPVRPAARTAAARTTRAADSYEERFAAHDGEPRGHVAPSAARRASVGTRTTLRAKRINRDVGDTDWNDERAI
jgi:hypothetical protein